MKRLLALPLALVLAACGTSGSVGTERAAQRAVVPIPARTPPPPETWPLDGAFVYQSDPLCAHLGVGYTLPDLTRSVCMRERAVEYIAGEVGAKRIVPGSGFKTCDWAWPSDPSWRSCVEYALRAVTPELRFGLSPYWTRGSIGNTEYEGCVAGVAYLSFVRISLHDLPRSYSLSAWETANALLRWTLDRGDLGDGPVVSAATSHAAAACGN